MEEKNTYLLRNFIYCPLCEYGIARRIEATRYVCLDCAEEFDIRDFIEQIKKKENGNIIRPNSGSGNELH